MSTNFALTTASPNVNIIQSLNYLLATQANSAATTGNINYNGNVLIANTTTGVISGVTNTGATQVGVISYLYGYVEVAYANTATGGGFTSNCTNQLYYGVHNTNSPALDTNPVDYQWTQVAGGGFGNTKYLYYTTGGGNTINFAVGNTAPNSTYSAVIDNTPILLATVSNTLVSTGAIQPQAATQAVFNSASGQVTKLNYVNGNSNPSSSTYLWPYNTRGFAIGGGTSIIPTENGSANAATGSSQIQITYNTYINTQGNATVTASNLIELWKGGSSTFYDNVYRAASGQINVTIDPYLVYFGGLNGTAANVNTTSTTYNNLVTGLSNDIYCSQTTNFYISNGVDGYDHFSVVDFFGKQNSTAYQQSYNITESGSVLPGTFGFNQTIWNPRSYLTTGNASATFDIYGAAGVVQPNPNALSNAYYPIANPLLSAPGLLVGSSGTIMRNSTYVPLVGTTGWSYPQTDAGTIEYIGQFPNLYSVAADNYGFVPATVNSGGYTSTPSSYVNYVTVGTSGTILVNTRNYYANGNTFQTSGWTQPVSGTINALYSVACMHSSTYGPVWVAVGQAGVILRSAGSFNNWQFVTSPTKNNLNAIGVYAYTSTLVFVAVGDNNTILTSTDGGNTWIVESSPATGRNLYSVTVIGSDSNFYVGGEEVILQGSGTAGATTWTIVYEGSPSYTTALSRLQYAGSWANVSQTTTPPAYQQIANAQVISGSYTDYNYAAGSVQTYYLVAGNMSGNANVYVGGANMTITEIKR